jgi:hypothetical protein
MHAYKARPESELSRRSIARAKSASPPEAGDRTAERQRLGGVVVDHVSEFTCYRRQTNDPLPIRCDHLNGHLQGTVIILWSLLFFASAGFALKD